LVAKNLLNQAGFYYSKLNIGLAAEKGKSQYIRTGLLGYNKSGTLPMLRKVYPEVEVCPDPRAYQSGTFLQPEN
jgi:hypothetical protein